MINKSMLPVIIHLQKAVRLTHMFRGRKCVFETQNIDYILTTGKLKGVTISQT